MDGILAHPSMPFFFIMEADHIHFGCDWAKGHSETIKFHMSSHLYEQWKRADKSKIRIAPGQPINASLFEEADVIEYLPHAN